MSYAITILEIILGLIYAIKIGVIGYSVYTKSRHTLFFKLVVNGIV